MAGEIMGLDGVAFGMHASSATALEDAEVCAIPYAQLTELAAGSASLQQVVSRMMSREILREHSLMMLLGSMNAEERLAAFLLNLVLETVSRTFSAFQQLRLLEVDKRHIRLLDLDGLRHAYSKCGSTKSAPQQGMGL